jgi:hypothetical protein
MIELILSHDGVVWRARNDAVYAAAATLEELDAEIGRCFRRAGIARDNETIRVFMAFDNAGIPQWIRQYAQHYFNRIVDIRAEAVGCEKEGCCD